METVLQNASYFYLTIAITLLACTHLFFTRIETKLNLYWPDWVSVTGGLSAAYVFIYLLPKLNLYSNRIDDSLTEYRVLDGTIIYFFMLFGFIAYWLVDLWNDKSRKVTGADNLNGLGFVFYNLLVGHLFVSVSQAEPASIVLITLVMVMHLLGLNHHFRHPQNVLFDAVLRWLFTGGLIIGAIIGSVILIPGWMVALLTAFVGGAILMNTIYYEIPHTKSARIWPFILGVVMFSAASLAIRTIRAGLL